tara:strand:+ start:1792 stop:2034 length:243 start_codon:yes stop_codon:yes gene_type:complete
MIFDIFLIILGFGFFLFLQRIAYWKGVKRGIRYSLLSLELSQDQVEILNNELKKDIKSLTKTPLRINKDSEIKENNTLLN